MYPGCLAHVMRGTFYCVVAKRRQPNLYIYIYNMCVFLALRHFFLFRPRFFPRALGSVARREPARTPHASLGLAEIRGTCSGGSKSHVRSGRDSERVEPSRPLQIHAQVKRLSDVSCDIWDLECHQCRQAILSR